MSFQKEVIRESIRKNYAAVALKGAEGCGCGCGCGTDQESTICCDPVEASKNLGYGEADLNSIPQNANMGLGCGNPVAMASLKEGDIVLDLGSGGGLDCFIARTKVGESGYVIGVDMTPEMISLSRKNAEEDGYKNVEFRLGEIENLPVADQTIDVIISNCVVNLSVDKERVFKEAYRVLKPGGRLCISDVVATADLPDEIKNDLAMFAGCIAGAEYVGNIERMLEKVGFNNILLQPKDNSKEILKAWSPEKKLEEYLESFIIEAQR